jgi:hypothetical protein
VIDIAQRPEIGKEESQEALALGERKRPEVEIVEPEQVEAEEGGGKLLRCALEIARSGEQRALLQPLEAGPP